MQNTEQYKKISLINQSIKTMMEIYGIRSPKTWKKNMEPIKKELDKMAGRKNYRNYTSRQVARILNHLGEPFNEA